MHGREVITWLQGNLKMLVANHEIKSKVWEIYFNTFGSVLSQNLHLQGKFRLQTQEQCQ